ncbi:uncharacterized protein BDR25DRAFT_120511 [Lindgomyces ingoldianus]|uniref:Uncharacterized protein n=1 Tax=Lindgomyces ingoldianus TaxID=673940 RepID=A0ACB6R760_9PLEO|nr:uncharacterized protein BDR25DRAFT_120511 [Lindgomyces ingoldianus]KAF2474276.1 hypothetical protein BDR25DRAFT_120511 [Lindgomyces ingoldianus]
MLQGIRASPLTMPSFGPNHLSLTGVQKMEGYGDVDSWSWPPQQPNTPPQGYSNVFDPSLYANFASQAPQAPESVHPRHHSIATSHLSNQAVTRSTHSSTPPPPRQSIAGNLIKAQPAFKPTWHGFLDTTKDAMTVVEAALQGRLSHISRRPHDKERAEMLTSGTVLVYEENASGIKRWTDAVHWSPSRVMNNCLIYRQLVRALKPEEKKAALNPSCGGKRKRKESTSPSITNTGESVNNAEDEYENPFDGGIAGDITPTTEPPAKVYANFAQSLTPDQQRRFCGSLVDSYEFKEGGLMKKTISVKYQGTHHHIISYYSLEDVVSGKLKRPFQDSKLADIQPRPELLTGWKVSLEDEESKDMPLVASYSQQLQPNHIQHPAVGTATQGITQTHSPLEMQMPTEYWHGGQVQQYSSTQHYAPPQRTASQYTPHHPGQPYPPQSTSAQQFTRQPAPNQQYHSQPPPSQQYPAQQAHNQQYSPQPPPSTQQYAPHQQSTQHYPPETHGLPVQQNYQQNPTVQYPSSHHTPATQQPTYEVPQPHVFDLPIHSPPSQTPVHNPTNSPIQQHDPQRRASAPVPIQSYGQPHAQAQYHTQAQSQTYYVADQKYPVGPGYGF